VTITYTKNEFPYYVGEGIEHELIWSTKELSSDEIVKIIEKEKGNKIEYLWFENPRDLRSIGSVNHYHVFSRQFHCEY